MTRVKWETMTDESQAMVKQVGLISIGGVIFLDFSKMIVPLVFLDIVHLFLLVGMFSECELPKIREKSRALQRSLTARFNSLHGTAPYDIEIELGVWPSKATTTASFILFSLNFVAARSLKPLGVIPTTFLHGFDRLTPQRLFDS